ncbi:GDSL family lipase [Salipiger aestuarii]|uniref:Lysophospholipase L1-like esterase n=1 Tax=Salipiger aestuarii TaxID=568098 RepID=A0A327YIY9_9RHOB|nr:SGNH/GDSL hydrolase family protein [Salipiger aestuarii]EIE52230.1 lipolytic enzyme, G-D-S-L [Citreicella sp. 357]KAA8609107.1 GDSL family lipase [Salipiger aestuarii]KAA8614308.1 GDSL family lipase [Salipiger aestuarii]KAB2542797.1 GDSL family lipase [Salipiger aestuarii]RAK20257.1 lysophospholipase L1-like esterase [Salipiger aestuarii]
MSAILCYGDSNTHGTLPMRVAGLSERLPKRDRWPEVAALALGPAHDVIAEGLPGRTTVHDDPVEGGCRNGLAVLPAILHSHKPLDLVVLMLGTNDLKPRFSVGAWDIARSVERLVICVRAEQVARDTLVVCPAPVRETGTLSEVFAGAEARQSGLEPHMRAMAARLGCAYVSAGDHLTVSPRDGVHWDADAHGRFGAAMARAIAQTLERQA